MEQYISKDALVAEIEKEIDSPSPSHDQQCDWEDGYWCGLSKAECIIDTLEVKEVGEPSNDLEKEIKEQIDKYYENCNKKLEEMGEDDNDISFLTLDGFARHFYELGLKSQKGE